MSFGVMRLLFVHQNLPGQYVHLMRWAKDTTGVNPAAITDQTNQRPDTVPTLRYQLKMPASNMLASASRRFAESIARAEATAKAAIMYKERGFVPDVILGHGAWGETFYLKEVFPDAKLICYAEFYYRSLGQNIGFDPEFDELQANSIRTISTQNATMTTSLLASDVGQVPTQFQANTFPAELRDKLSVLFDGVDTDAIAPDPNATYSLSDGTVLRAGDPIITFVNRNFEPYRGYHTFMRALPEILGRNPSARVIMIGGDSVSYGPPPSGKKSWKEIFLDEVRDRIDVSRVHYVGQVPTGELRRIFQVSAVHVYLTYPFVLSWSMMEAMSAGCLVIGSDVAPVREVLHHNENGILTDFFDYQRLAEHVSEALESPSQFQHLRENARAHIRKNYDLRTVCLPAQIELIKELL
jgi:glycosyltransferase involved in cell wall biosynthesis